MGITRFIPNENYSPYTFDYDIALIVLAESLLFGASMHAIALPSMNETIADNTMCVVTGWGSQKRFTLFNRTKLRAVDVPVVNQQSCQNDYESTIDSATITPRMICAGFKRGGKDACEGDSGGPLNCPSTKLTGASVLFGIVSWGYDCGQPNYPGVYTRVSALRNWIYSNSGI